MPKRICVTGNAGFIGSHFVDLLLKKEYIVVGVDSFTYAASKKNIGSALRHKNFTQYYVNVCNASDMYQILNKDIDWVVNFAAETHVDNSIKNCDAFIKTNIDGVKNILETCRKTKTKLLHVSTDEVYGETFDRVTEYSMLDPRNPYSATKAAGEHLIRAYANTYGNKFIIVRPANNFGPRQHDEKLLPTIVQSIVSKKKIPIYGDGSQVRDWLFVKDCSAMIEKLLDEKLLGHTFNLTTDNYFCNLVLTQSIINLINKKEFTSDWAANNKNEFIEFVEDRLGHDKAYYHDGSKFYTFVTDFEASNFEKSLSETITWYNGIYRNMLCNELM